MFFSTKWSGVSQAASFITGGASSAAAAPPCAVRCPSTPPRDAARFDAAAARIFAMLVPGYWSCKRSKCTSSGRLVAASTTPARAPGRTLNVEAKPANRLNLFSVFFFF